MLWLCLHFPRLALEVFTRTTPLTDAFAVYASRANHAYIHCNNETAHAQGIQPGMRLNAAYALCSDLTAQARNPKLEQQALARIAAWAGQFTSLVNLQPPQAILLEVSASIKLFGGLRPLYLHVQHSAQTLGYQYQQAIAPTPRAAQLLAQSKPGTIIHHPKQLPEQLQHIDLTHLDLSDKLCQRLQKLGLQSIQDCLRLPRDGFARRFGPSLLQVLDQISGQAPDPRSAFHAPEKFSGSVLLAQESANSEALLFAIFRLLQELNGFLRAREQGLQKLTLRFIHHQQNPTEVVFHFASATNQLARLQAMIRERMQYLQLPAAALQIDLHSGALLRVDVQNRDLFQATPTQADTLDPMLEKIRMRLGHTSVYSLCTIAEHRPEKAWRICEPGQSTPIQHFTQRPTWLLEPPQALKVVHHTPTYQGPLQLLAGPERIESGWWDGHDVARDYFIASNRAGSRLWIFQDRKNPQAWYLHGLFE